MIEKIKNRLPEGFERKLFLAAIGNLEDKANPLRFNNFAYATRELTRHVLKRLAPDQNVMGCNWYIEETGKEKGVSRRQRLYYAVQGGLSDDFVQNQLNIDVLNIHKALRDAINKLSKHTHIEEATFNTGKTQVDKMVEETIAAIYEIFNTMDDCRNSLVSALWEYIDSSLIDTALSETITSIDKLATHHSIEEIYTDKVYISEIDTNFVYFMAEGSIGCELQWGSNSDLRRGDGATVEESFPFHCKLWSPVDEPTNISTDENALCVDTTSWSEGTR